MSKLESILFIKLILLFSTSIWADSVIPYSGTLHTQGKPVSQSTPIKMGFALYTESPTFQEDQLLSTTPVNTSTRRWTSWTGDQAIATPTVDIYVRNGRFLANLGEVIDSNLHQGLSDSVFDQVPLYLVIWVLADSEDPESLHRLPPQKLNTVPHAVTAKRATSFEVSGNVSVGGDLTVIENTI